MNKIVRWYNQNKTIVFMIALSIIALIFIIQALDKYYEKKVEKESSSTNSTTAYNTNTYSIITQDKIDETTSQKSDNLINEFFDYCNNGNIEEAYNLLSNNCKTELYPTINEFKEKYYNLVFTEKRSYDSVLWINTIDRNTYRVQIMSDLLATGQREYMPIEDYYTIVNENGEYKLNVNKFVGKKDINISKEQFGLNVTILSKKSYIDYEIYEVKIENSSTNKVIFNTKENPKSIYLQDENDLKHIAFLNEISDNELNIFPGFTRNLQIKFNRGYKPKIDIIKVVFEDIKINNNEQKENLEIDL